MSPRNFKMAASRLAVLAGLAAVVSFAGCQEPAVAGPAVMPCASDDGQLSSGGVPCRWDATRRGNGAGRSFTVYPAPGGTVLVYDLPGRGVCQVVRLSWLGRTVGSQGCL